MSKDNAVQSFSLTGDFGATPLAVLETRPEKYKRPARIIVRRTHGVGRYRWTERRETALTAAWRAARRGKDSVTTRLMEGLYTFQVSDEATALALAAPSGIVAEAA